MQMVRKLLVLAFGCVAYAAQAQVSCVTSTKLICLVPFGTNAVPPNATTSAATLNQAFAFNGPLAAQLSQLPLAASAPGATILTVNGNPLAFDNLGPILLDRPDSVGRGHLVLGFSFQQFHFNEIDGIGIGSIPFVYQQSSNQANTQYPVQYLSETLHASLKLNQYVALATYGLPWKTDVSVIVPFARVSIGAASLNPITYPISSVNVLEPGLPGQNSNTAGVANGIGDVSFNVKHILWNGGDGGRGSLATGFALRIPTGDALNYLGSGAYGYNLYALASYKSQFSPHVKIGYQWNTNSVLLNPTGLGANQNLPGGAQFAVGADYAIARSITASADLLANQFVNSKYLTPSTVTIPSSSVNASGSGSATLNTITPTDQTYTPANVSLGLKLKPLGPRKGLILFGNVLIQVNNVGLRSYPSPSFGISYNLNTKR
jgi:hypothetical protein